MTTYLEKYTQLEIIGEGGYGVVYKGRDNATGDLVAIKILRNGAENNAQSTNKAEIAIMQRLNAISCSRTIGLLDVYEHKSNTVIIMPLVPGAEVLEQDLDNEDYMALAYQLCATVNCLHINHIYHLDIKPENIMYNKATKSLTLIDFGLGCYTHIQDTCKQLRRRGTPAYMSPQMIESKVLTPAQLMATDIWATITTLYLLLAHNYPAADLNKQDYNTYLDIHQLELLDITTRAYRDALYKTIDLVKYPVEMRSILQEYINLLLLPPDERIRMFHRYTAHLFDTLTPHVRSTIEINELAFMAQKLKSLAGR